MPNPAKIFISSAYDRDLIPLRSDLKQILEEAGHFPLLFEENFFPWETNFMRTCLQKVEESNIFILYLNENVGTYWETDKSSPTYLEFRKAIDQKKYIIAFLDAKLKSQYGDIIEADLVERYKAYRERYGKNPDYTIDIVEEVIAQDLSARQRSNISHIHPFIWAFIYDVRARGIWTEELEIARAEAAHKKVKEYLSDRLGEGIKFVPMKDAIYENALAVEEFSQYQQYTSTLLCYLNQGKIINWSDFLKEGIKPLEGGAIHQRPGTDLAEEVGKFKSCEAMTVYKAFNGNMKLCGSYNVKDPEIQYDLTDINSYVVTSYTQNANEIGYSEAKNLLYYTLKIDEYVLCFHYPMGEGWNEQKVEAFKKEIEYAIIDKTLFTDFLADLIGGIQHDC